MVIGCPRMKYPPKYIFWSPWSFAFKYDIWPMSLLSEINRLLAISASLNLGTETYMQVNSRIQWVHIHITVPYLHEIIVSHNFRNFHPTKQYNVYFTFTTTKCWRVYFISFEIGKLYTKRTYTVYPFRTGLLSQNYLQWYLLVIPLDCMLHRKYHPLACQRFCGHLFRLVPGAHRNPEIVAVM